MVAGRDGKRVDGWVPARRNIRAHDGKMTNPEIRPLAGKARQDRNGGAWLRRLRCKTASANETARGGPVASTRAVSEPLGRTISRNDSQTKSKSSCSFATFTSFATDSSGAVRRDLQQTPRGDAGCP